MKFATRVQRSAWLAAALLLAAAGSASAQLPPNTFANVQRFNFAYQTGTPAVQPQILQVISETARNFTVTPTVTTPAGGAWLTVNSASSAVNGTTGTATSFVTVGINPAGLVAGVYQGNLRLVLVGVAQPVDIPVTLRVSALPQISIPLQYLNIQGVSGSQVANTIPVNSTSTPTTYSTTAWQYNPAGTWLTIVPASGTTNAAGGQTGNVTINANLVGLSAGLYYAVVNFRAAGDDGDVSLPVILTVSQATTVSANPDKINFAFQASNLSATPTFKTINVVGSNGANIAYTATVTGDPRVTLAKASTGPGAVTVNGSTPENIFVLVNPAGLVAGTTVEASIAISSAQNTAPPIPVKVTVTNSPLLIANPDSVNFAYSLGATVPSAQTITLTGTSVLGYTVTEAEVSGGDWLTVSTAQGFTPGQISVSLNPVRLQQLAAGTYTANITITSPSAGNNPLVVPVTLTVSGTTLLTVSPSTLDFAGEVNGRVPDNKTFSIQSTDASNQNYTLRVEPASPWLVLNKTSGATGALGDVVTVGVDPTKVTEAKKYEADVVVVPQTTTSGAVGQRVHVTFNVTTGTTVTVTPARIDATQTGATPPAAVALRIASAIPGVSFNARADATWLTVTPTSGTTPLDIAVNFNSATLAPGTYESSVTILPVGATPVTVPVKLVVQSAAALTLTQSTFSVSAMQGAAPSTLTLGLTSSGVALPFTAAATSTGNWLAVSPATGATAAAGGQAVTLTLTINPTGLAPGTYTGTVALTSPNASNSPQTITVNLTITPIATPVIRSVENAARNEATLITPGLIVAIKGTNLGPTTGVVGAPTSGAYPTTLSEVRVLFDNIPAPIIFVRQDQVNAVAPYALFGRTSTRVVIEYRGVRSDPIEYRVVDAAPGIFTQDATGRGLGAILNQNSTVNTATNPARRGEVVALYATGEGQVAPAGTDGRVTTGTLATFPRPVLPVTVKVNGVTLPSDQVTYAGAAPGLIAGALQVNFRLPTGLNIQALTQVPVEITVGTFSSQPGVTVAVIP